MDVEHAKRMYAHLKESTMDTEELLGSIADAISTGIDRLDRMAVALEMIAVVQTDMLKLQMRMQKTQEESLRLSQTYLQHDGEPKQ